MIKSRIIVYVLLFLFLSFVALKANQNLNFRQNNSKDFFKTDTSMSIKPSMTTTTVKKTSKVSPTKTSETSTTKIKNEVFATYSIIVKDQVIQKNLYKFKKGTKLGLINDERKIVIKPVYDSFAIFDEQKGIYVSIRNKKQGLFNYKGKMLVPTKYEYFTKTLNDDFVIINNSKYAGLYDLKNAKSVVPAIFTKIQSLDLYNWKVISNDKVGFVHSRYGKNNFIQPKYDIIDKYKMVYLTASGNKLGVIDSYTGQVISEPMYDEITVLNEQDYQLTNILIFRTKIDNRYGVIYYSPDYSTTISPIYDDVQFKGLVNVFSNGYWRILDNKGNVVSRAKSAFK